MTMTELAIKRPSLVVVFFSALTLFGVIAFSRLQYELLPKIAPPVITISTPYPGASPSEVETNVTKVIEDAVSGMDKVDNIKSKSQEGVSFVTISLQQNANSDLGVQEAQRKINAVTGLLPQDAKTPIISKFAVTDVPVIRASVTSTLPSRELYQLVKDQIVPRFSKLEGVGQVQLVGGEERQIRINIDAEKLRSFGLSIVQVVGAIKSANVEYPTGKVEEERNQFIVRVAGKVGSLEQLKEVIVARLQQPSNGDMQSSDGMPGGQTTATDAAGIVRLKDIAEIQDGSRDILSINRLNGETTIGILINKASDANAVTVSELVRNSITNIEKEFAADKLIFSIAQDASEFTINAANAVIHDLEIAIVLVALVMLLFLHSFRSSLIVMVAIPASLVGTFIAIYLFGFSLNLMTLLGLSLVIGILVDDSIVVLENIFHHLEMGKDRRTAALVGRNEIGFAALSITMVDVVVFLPLCLLPGITGNVLREFAAVVAVATLFSLLVSFTITPVLASRFANVVHLDSSSLMGRFGLAFDGWFKRAGERYDGWLRWVLAHRLITIGIVVIMLGASFSLIPLGYIGSEFIATADRGEFTVTIELPSGARLEQTNRITMQVEEFIRTIPEVRKIFTNVGAGAESYTNNSSQINVTLSPLAERQRTTEAIGLQIKQAVASIPGITVRVDPIGLFGTSNESPITIVFNSNNYDVLAKTAVQVRDIVKNIPGTTDVRLSSEEGKPETRVEINREKLSDLGLSIGDVGATLRLALSGDGDSKFRDIKNNSATDYIIRIGLDKFDRSRVDQVGALTVVNNKGQHIQLNQFANIYVSAGPSKLERENRSGAVTLYAQVVGKSSGAVADEITQALKNKLPTGVSYRFTGEQERAQSAFSALLIAVATAITLVYLVMVALYDSYISPFVVMFSVPVALVGSLLAMALAGKSLGIFTGLGNIMLIGLVTKNAILLVDRANDMRREHNLSPFDAIIEAGQARLRPIVMTTIAIVIGLVPVALSNAPGSEWKSGLGWALMGGLTSSMFLTLLVVPIVYVSIGRLQDRFSKSRTQKKVASTNSSLLEPST